MPFQKIEPEHETVTQPGCTHLRSKAMYVTGQLGDTTHLDEEGSKHCWCNLTQHVLGPDHQEVSREACVAGRGCYKEHS